MSLTKPGWWEWVDKYKYVSSLEETKRMDEPKETRIETSPEHIWRQRDGNGGRPDPECGITEGELKILRVEQCGRGEHDFEYPNPLGEHWKPLEVCRNCRSVFVPR